MVLLAVGSASVVRKKRNGITIKELKNIYKDFLSMTIRTEY